MDADVLIVGLGPVGLALAVDLGARGLSVLGVDAAARPSPLPRGATADDTVLGILSRLGITVSGPSGLELSVLRRVTFETARGRRVTLLEPGVEAGPLGHPRLVGWHQPDVERALERAALTHPSVQLRWGTAVCGVTRAGAGGAGVELTGGSTLHARWVVGCDGGRGVVRNAIGVALVGRTFPQRWEILDLLGSTDALPGPADEVVFGGDPRAPSVSVPTGPTRRRIESLLRTTGGDARRPAWKEPALDAGLTVERHATYDFHARIADSWRVERVLLAGDAAHLMPPFAGRGLGEGLRDVDALGWRLAAVLAGCAPESSLDGYERERRPAVAREMRLARGMGAVLQTRRPRAAAVRDGALRGLDAGPWAGVLRRLARPDAAAQTAG